MGAIKPNKTVGIVCDNYKLEKFKSELAAFEFTVEEGIASIKTKIIKIKCHEHQILEIKRICERVELHFKNRN